MHSNNKNRVKQQKKIQNTPHPNSPSRRAVSFVRDKQRSCGNKRNNAQQLHKPQRVAIKKYPNDLKNTHNRIFTFSASLPLHQILASYAKHSHITMFNPMNILARQFHNRTSSVAGDWPSTQKQSAFAPETKSSSTPSSTFNQLSSRNRRKSTMHGSFGGSSAEKLDTIIARAQHNLRQPSSSHQPSHSNKQVMYIPHVHRARHFDSNATPTHNNNLLQESIFAVASADEPISSTQQSTSTGPSPRAKRHPRLESMLQEQENNQNSRQLGDHNSDVDSGNQFVSRDYTDGSSGSSDSESQIIHPPHLIPHFSDQPVIVDDTSQTQHAKPYPTQPHHLTPQEQYDPVGQAAGYNAPSSLPGACSLEEALECVVKIFVTQSVPNYLQPWQSRPSSDHMGSGFIIKGKRIMTNAHVVADALVVMVRRPGSSRKYIAKVVASAHECDLALLEVDDAMFWKDQQLAHLNIATGTIEAIDEETSNSNDNDENDNGNDTQQTSDLMQHTTHNNRDNYNTLNHPSRRAAFHQISHHQQRRSDSELPGVGPGSVGAPWWATLAPDVDRPEDAPADIPVYTTLAPFRKEPGCLYFSPSMPLLQENIVVIGYPLGGDNVCITQGVVSRIEPTSYAHTNSFFLAVQIDAAINPGNSGGPAFIDGRVAGVAFQNITNASNVGYIIPTPIIMHFIRDVQRGAYRISSKSPLPSAKSRTSHLLAPTSTVPLSVSPQPPLPATIAADHRFFKPYLSGFCRLGMMCQETTSPSLRNHIGLNSCVKLIPINDNETGQSPNDHLTLRQAIRELHHNNPIRPSHISDQLAVQQENFMKTSRSNEPAAPPTTSQTDSPESSIFEQYSMYNFDSAGFPAAYAHYHNLIDHIREDIRRKRQFPQLEFGTQKVADLTPNSIYQFENDHDQHESNEQHKDQSSTLSHHHKNNLRFRSQQVSGVLINSVSQLSPLSQVVRPGDVLIAVDGYELGNDGTVHFRGHERIAFDHLESLKHKSQTIQLTILRKKKTSQELRQENQQKQLQQQNQQPLNKSANHLAVAVGAQEPSSKKSLPTPQSSSTSSSSSEQQSPAEPQTPATSISRKRQFDDALYRHRIVAPCDHCRNTSAELHYNATYPLRRHQAASDIESVVRNAENDVETWNTALGVAPEYVALTKHQRKQQRKAKQEAEEAGLQHNHDHIASNPQSLLVDEKNTPSASSPSHNHHRHPSHDQIGSTLPNVSALPTYDNDDDVDITGRLPVINRPLAIAEDQSSQPNNILTKNLMCVQKGFELLTVTAPATILPSTAPFVHDRGTSYVFFGGLLFMPMSMQYLKDVGDSQPFELVMMSNTPLKSPDEEHVVLAQVLQHNETVGYPMTDRPVTHICGVPVRNMSGLLEVIQTKVLTSTVCDLIRDEIKAHPEDVLTLMAMLSSGNSLVDSEKATTPALVESHIRCQRLFQLLCVTSDILCSQTDLTSYTEALVTIYNESPNDSLWKPYLTQAVDMYVRPKPGTSLPRPQTVGTVHQIHNRHSTPSKQAIFAIFDNHDIVEEFHRWQQQQPEQQATADSSDPGQQFSLPISWHTMTVQTADNRVIALDMEKAMEAHYHLKHTLNI